MNRFKQTVSLVLMLALVSIGLTAQAQRPRLNNYQLNQLIRNVENGAVQFRSSLNAALDNYSYDSPRRADNINAYMSDFNQALTQLRTRFDRRVARAADVQLLLDRATLIDAFMNRNQLDTSAESDWTNERAQLNELARAYGIYWRPGSTTSQTAPYPIDNPPYPTNNGPYNRPYGNNTMLTGTYQLDSTQSDNARRQAEIAARSVPYSQRQQVIDNLMRRLEAPDQIAIERRGRTVTIASTRAPQITFDADGVERTETRPSGRTVRTVASLNGNQLIVSTTGDRGNDFNVTFDPADYGRRLYVTRRISDVNMSQPVTVRSVYTRTSDVARFDIYNGSQYPNNAGYGTTNGTFIIPNNTELVATLDNDLSTRNAREGDRFTMTVRDPAQYAGAVIEGTVGRIQRSGRISGRSELSLNLDTIRLRDGSSYRFGGIIESVRTPNGEQARVDTEGTVQEGGNSRGETTAERAAIGTAVGAIIGAIAGGGKGAAIGAILGAGGGAGSVYVQGSDDLELTSGTEMTIRAGAPR
jgi:hypothetical protein